MIAATNGWLCAFDNLSFMPNWLSDALCRLSTGGGFSTRSLYTDDEERIFEAKRPVILNGIEEIATRGDLLDRTLIAYVPRIHEHAYQPESQFWAEFEKARPAILGALFQTLSAYPEWRTSPYGSPLQNLNSVGNQADSSRPTRRIAPQPTSCH